MEKTALILGGTKGLGLALAKEALSLQIKTLILGREIAAIQNHPELSQAEFLSFDLLKDEYLPKLNNQFDYFIWSAGVFLKKPLRETSDVEIDAMINLHFRQPIRLLRDYLKQAALPVHLIVIASSSAWKLRETEAIYTGIKAAQASFTRNLVPELCKQLPHSKVTLINPGGLNTPNFHKDHQFSQEGIFLEPECVAKIIWEKALSQTDHFSEWQILRDKSGKNASQPIVTLGPRLPEVP